MARNSRVSRKTLAIVLALVIGLLAVPLNSAVAAPTTNGLLLYYNMDGNANDLSGNNRNGTANGAVAFSAGKDGQAAFFNNNANNYIGTPQIGAALPQVTVAFWLKVNSIPNQFNGLFHINGWSTGSMSFALGGTNSPVQGGAGACKLAFNVNGMGNDNILSNFSFDPTNGNDWTHVAVTYDSSAKIGKFYINGALDSTSALQNSQAINLTAGEIGAYWGDNASSQSQSRPLNGGIDEFRIYNRVLSDAEIFDLTNGFIQPPGPPPQIDWKRGLNGAAGFNEDTFKTIPKLTNASNNNWWDASVSANGEIGFMESCDPNEDVFIFNNTKLVEDNDNIFETPNIFPALAQTRTDAINGTVNGTSGTPAWRSQVDTFYTQNFGTGSWGMEWPRAYQPAAQYRIKNNDYTSFNGVTSSDAAGTGAGNANLHTHNAGYNRYTNFETGEVGAQWVDSSGNQWNRRSFASRADNVIVTYIESPDNKDINLTLSIDLYREMSNAGGAFDTDYILTQDGNGKAIGYGMVGKYPVANRKGSIDVQERLFARGGWGSATRIVTDGSVTSTNGTRTYSGTSYNNPVINITGTKSVMLITKVDRIDSGCNNLADVKTKLYDVMLGDINGIVNNYSVTNSDAGYSALLAPHAAIHGAMFNNVRIDLCSTPDETADRKLTNTALIEKQNADPTTLNKAFLERIYNNGRFGLICSSGYQTARLGGIWNGQWDPQWSGDFTLDANTNLQISGMNTGNIPDASDGYVNFIVRNIADWEANAANVYGMTDAIKAPPRVDGTGESAGYHFDSGYPHIYVNGITDWLITPVFEYWQCYGDRQIKVGKDINLSALSASKNYVTGQHASIASVLGLTQADVDRINATGYMDLEKDILYPLITKTMNFWLQYVNENYWMAGDGTPHANDGTTLSQALKTDPNARYLFTPGYSPENQPANRNNPLAYNSAMDISAARNTLFMGKSLLDALNPPDKGTKLAAWADFESKLPSYYYTSAGDFKEWATPQLTENDAHRHDSHAYAAWPGYEAQNDFTVRTGLQKAMDSRSAAYGGTEAPESHGPVHKLLIESRLKRGSEVERIAKYLMTSNYQNASMTSNHNSGKGSSFCTDSANGIFGGINESLVYSNFGVVEILPALMPSLTAGSVSGLRARNNSLINNLVWDKNAKTASVTITTDEAANDIKLMCGFGIEKALINGARQNVLTDAQGRSYVELNLVKGQSVTVDVEFEKTNISISTQADISNRLVVGTTVKFDALITPSSVAASGTTWYAVDPVTGAPMPGSTFTKDGLMTIGSDALGRYVKVYAVSPDGTATSNSLIVKVSNSPPATTDIKAANLDYGFGYYVVQTDGVIGYVCNSGYTNGCVFVYKNVDFTDLKSIDVIRTYNGACSVTLYADLTEAASKTLLTGYFDTSGIPLSSYPRYTLGSVTIDAAKAVSAAVSIASASWNDRISLNKTLTGPHTLYVYVTRASGETWAGNYSDFILNYSRAPVAGDLPPNSGPRADGKNMVVDVFNKYASSTDFRVIWAAYKNGTLVGIASDLLPVAPMDVNRVVLSPQWTVSPDKTVVYVWHDGSFEPYESAVQTQ